MAAPKPATTERRLLALIASVQFINVLDFMMVMPMGPDFARALGISSSHLGVIGGAYTASAAVSGLAGSFFLDRFDRKKALVWSVLGLALGTIAGGFAWNLSSLVAARLLAGFFGGPVTSLSYSIVADAVPIARRGRAMGVVMGAFSLASILGVPAGLELARLGGWRMPFFLIGGVCLVITLMLSLMLPSFRAHLASDQGKGKWADLVRPDVAQMLLLISLAMIGAFMMIPNLSAYLQFNLGYPREHIGYLYLIGGIFSFFTMRIAGHFVDRKGPAFVSVSSAALLIFSMIGGYYFMPPIMPIWALFATFMIAMSIRGVCMTALSSRVPAARDRARYMSIQSAIQHVSSSIGAMWATTFLVDRADQSIDGMPTVAVIASVIAVIVPVLFWRVERAVKLKEARLVVRGAREGDREAVGELLIRSFVDTYARKMPEVVVSDERKANLRRALDFKDRGFVVVAEANGQVLGTVMLLKPEDQESRAWKKGHAYLRYMAVDPTSHKRGVGDELMRAAIGRAREWGCEGVCLHIRRGADGLGRFYGKHGFQREETGDQDHLPEIFLEAYRLGVAI